MERIIEALNIPMLTRIWMEGNLRWLIHVLSGLLFVFLTAAMLLFFPSTGMTGLVIAGTLVTFFLFKFTGLKNGLLVTPICSLPEGNKRIALTFDDGPDATQTEKILDILAEHDIPGTFFFTGLQIDKNPQIALKAAQRGHAIGNHSYSHDNLRLAGLDRIKTELSKFEKSLKNAGLPKTTLFRPPHGAKSPLLEAVIKQSGYQLVHWNLTAKDWKAEPAEQILKRLVEHTSPGSIVLLHDTPNAVKILPEYIVTMKGQGYEFKRVSESI